MATPPPPLFKNPFHRIGVVRADPDTISRIEDLIRDAFGDLIDQLVTFLRGAGLIVPGNPQVKLALPFPGVVYTIDAGGLRVDPTHFTYDDAIGSGGGALTLLKLASLLWVGPDLTNPQTNGTLYVDPHIGHLSWNGTVELGGPPGVAPGLGRVDLTDFVNNGVGLGTSDAIIAIRTNLGLARITTPAAGRWNLTAGIGHTLELGVARSNNGFGPAPQNDLQIDGSGDVTAGSLAGSGSALIQADATGKLSRSGALGAHVLTDRDDTAIFPASVDTATLTNLAGTVSGNLYLVGSISGGVTTFKWDYPPQTYAHQFCLRADLTGQGLTSFYVVPGNPGFSASEFGFPITLPTDFLTLAIDLDMIVHVFSNAFGASLTFELNVSGTDVHSVTYAATETGRKDAGIFRLFSGSTPVLDTSNRIGIRVVSGSLYFAQLDFAITVRATWRPHT